jgi:hypothetical protein
MQCCKLVKISENFLSIYKNNMACCDIPHSLNSEYYVIISCIIPFWRGTWYRHLFFHLKIFNKSKDHSAICFNAYKFWFIVSIFFRWRNMFDLYSWLLSIYKVNCAPKYTMSFDLRRSGLLPGQINYPIMRHIYHLL